MKSQVNKMKKIISILLIGALAISLTACSQDSSSSTSSDSSVSSSEQSTVSDDSSSEDSGESSSEASDSPDSSADNSSETESSTEVPIDGEKLPTVEGSDDFVAAFTDNPIDTAYLETLNSSESVVSMVRAGNSASSQWQSEIDSAYSTLLNKLTDSDKIDALKAEQTSWENNLSTEINNVKTAVTSTGSLANVEISYGAMLLYRERAAALLSQLYDITGEINITTPSGEAAG
jgi:hypothetical protein